MIASKKIQRVLSVYRINTKGRIMSINPPVTLQIQLQKADSSPNTPQPPVPTTTPDQFRLADNTEIHKAKMGASAWAGVFGFFKTGWDALFYDPKKAASKRKDVLNNERSFESAITLEKEKKVAQQKASILPASVYTALLIISYVIQAPAIKKCLPEFFTILKNGMKSNISSEEINRQLDNLSDRLKEDPLYKKLKKIIAFIQTLKWINLALGPLLYGFFEQPDSPDFNKQL
jgi:hypothetical protein